MTIRAARVSDAESIARVHVRAWQAAYRGLVAQDYLDGMRWEPRVARWAEQLAAPARAGHTLQVAVDAADDVLGFAEAGPARDPEFAAKEVSELYVIYLAPEVSRRGIGGRLLSATLAVAGDERAILWVFRDNAGARGFYERHGFLPDGAAQMLTIGGGEIQEIRYRRGAPDARAPDHGRRTRRGEASDAGQ